MTFVAAERGLVLFLIGFAVHVCWWRIARPIDDFRGLVACFVVAPVCLGGALWLAFPDYGSARELAGSALATLFSGGIYIMLYPAAQAASPTMLLVLRIARAGKAGETRQALGAVLDDATLSRKSIDDLVHERFAAEVDGKLHIAARGAVLLKLLTTWRGLLGLEYGSG